MTVQKVLKIPGEGIYYSIGKSAEMIPVSNSTLGDIIGKNWGKYVKLLKEKGFEIKPNSIKRDSAGNRYLRYDLVDALSSVYWRNDTKLEERV